MAISMDSILKLSTTKKVLILAAVLSCMTGLYIYLLFIPRQDEIKVLRSELDKLEGELNESKMIVRDLEKFKAQVEKLNTELINALTQLPNEKEVPELLKNISSLGKESNLEFILFRPKPEELQQFYAKVPIELVVLGNYHNTGIFFDKVSKLPRIINVVDFNMTRADAKGARDSRDEVLLRSSCLLNTYRFIEQKSEGKKSESKEMPKGTEKETSKTKKD
jgi:type IV pilus assembly protein PilO